MFLNLIPSTLDTPEFLDAWSLFVEHRKQKKKVLTEGATAMLLKRLAKFKTETAIRLLERSISNGWQGVIFDKDIPDRESNIKVNKLWERWIKARRKIGMTDPARGANDVASFNTMSFECKSGEEYTAAFLAYLEDLDPWIVNKGHPLEFLPGRLNKYTMKIHERRGHDTGAEAKCDKTPLSELFD